MHVGIGRNRYIAQARTTELAGAEAGQRSSGAKRGPELEAAFRHSGKSMDPSALPARARGRLRPCVPQQLFSWRDKWSENSSSVPPGRRLNSTPARSARGTPAHENSLHTNRGEPAACPGLPIHRDPRRSPWSVPEIARNRTMSGPADGREHRGLWPTTSLDPGPLPSAIVSGRPL